MQNIPVLSICIPVNGRLEYVRNTLKSIYSEKNLSDCNQNDFEVIVSDNESSKSLEILSKEFEYNNFKYFHTQCDGFMNSYFALTNANGCFIKLHNSQEVFNSGALGALILSVKRNLIKKPLMFFTSGLLQKGTIREYNNFNEFNYNLSYLSSWSNGFSIWKDDFDLIDASVSLNTFFPHTSVFFTQYSKSSFIINDQHLFTTQFVKKRGGHNKFYAFSIEYPSLIENVCNLGYIKLETKKQIFKDILNIYLPLLFFNVKIAKRESFSSDDFKSNLRVYFPPMSYLKVILFSCFIPLKILWRKIKLKYFLKSQF